MRTRLLVHATGDRAVCQPAYCNDYVQLSCRDVGGESRLPLDQLQVPASKR